MRKILKTLSVFSICFSLLLLNLNINYVKAASLTNGSVTISDSRPSTTSVSYTIDFDNVTTSAIKCIQVAFSSSISSQTKPTGMDITSAAFSSSSDYIPNPGSWGIANNNSIGVSQIKNVIDETPANASDRTVVLTGITNGSTAATAYYVLFNTYTDFDCETGLVDSGVVAFIYTAGQLVTATVDPTLTFTVNAVNSGQAVNGATTTITTTSGTVPLGTLTSAANSIGAHDLTIGTNAQGGYTVTIKYTGQLASGTHNFTDHTGTNATPTTFSSAGTESFGYTTNDTTLGTGTPNRFSSNKWAAFTTSPLEVAYSATAASETIRVGYQAGVSTSTPAGFYQTTVIYVATPTY